jgi:dolichol-phosphate mannosyltransferase
MCDVDIPTDTGDFRIMSRRVADALITLREKHRFIRGMVPWLGFKSAPFEYVRESRYAGVTKYPLSKMLIFAINAILSFSKKPLAVSTRVGIFTIALGIGLIVFFVYIKLFTNRAVPGISAVIVSVVFFSGVQLTMIGILGEYVARIFDEVKGRPLYVVKDSFNIKGD